MNTDQVVCPPGLRQWVIVKSGDEYEGGPGYNGPTCCEADVPAQQVYFSKRSAMGDCQRLNSNNPDRFIVKEYKERDLDKKEFTAKLAEYYDRWKDQRKDYVTDLLGESARKGVVDFLHFIDPMRFSLDKQDQKQDHKKPEEDVKDLKHLAGVPPQEPLFTADGVPVITCTNIVSLKGKGVIFMVKPTPSLPFATLMGLAGKDVFVNGKLYRVINAESASTDKGGKGDVGLVVQEKGEKK